MFYFLLLIEIFCAYSATKLIIFPSTRKIAKWKKLDEKLAWLTILQNTLFSQIHIVIFKEISGVILKLLNFFVLIGLRSRMLLQNGPIGKRVKYTWQMQTN